jgi:uncharacterized protein YdeI (YjbR/CyaY-like superfamily)
MTSPKFFENAPAFRQWLEANAANTSELIVGFHKVDSGRHCMTWSQSVDEALCFGWIDGVRKRIDECSYLIRFTPRKRGSIWSAVNIVKVERLRAEGRMTEAGEQAFSHRTKAKSIIYSYEQVVIAELSGTEIRIFKQKKAAWRFLEATPPSYRKAILHWVTSAKRPETRAARFTKLVEACAVGKRLR